MAFLRRRDGGDGEGDGQQPAEQPGTPQTPEDQTSQYGYGQPTVERSVPEEEQPTTEQPAADQSTVEHEQPAQPTVEQEQPEPQAPAVTRERTADPMSASERAAAEDQSHRDARPQTAEDIPDNIWEQTRSGEDPYMWHSGTKRPHGSTDAIEFIDVKKSFGRNTILNGLNLGIPDDQISMILGPSGTGKSVCIKHMVGLLYPDEGDVLVHGQSVPNLQDDELFEMRKKFGVLFQDGALFGSMNLFDNVAFPLRQHTDKGEDEIHEIVSRRLREVGLSGAGDKMPNELSGGMRKRAGFARALVLEPDIVLFDEPDSGLDPVRTALLCELIKEIHQENGGAYVVITHDIMSARRVADYIAVLWKGRIVESGPASELFNSPNQFVRQFLSGEAQGPLGME
jgi:phospholipid/cholesterol/gamma-HCH transport system ATP-binding protein